MFISSEVLFRVIRIPACCHCVSMCRGSFSPKENKRGSQISCFTLVWSQLPPRMNRLEKFSVFYRNSKTQNFICRAVHMCSCICARYRGGKADTAQLPQLQAVLSTDVPDNRLGDPVRRKEGGGFRGFQTQSSNRSSAFCQADLSKIK